ncbi:JHY protein, partial [Geococcyx californianus]|nr:JHY protein [Geococcyx californianus]
RDSQGSGSESQVQERQDQLEPQQWIPENEELVGLDSDELENDSLEEDSLEEMSLKELEVEENDTNRHKSGIQRNGVDGRKQQSMDKYSSLRYNPNWKNTKEAAEISEAIKAHQVGGGSSVDLSQDSFYLHSSGFSEEKSQLEAKSQDLFSELGSELLSFHESDAVFSNDTVVNNDAAVNNGPVRLSAKGKGSADRSHLKDSPNIHSSAFFLHIQEDQPKRTKKDFVKKNRRTLGLHSKKINSYLQLYSKKQEVLQEQVADPKTVDEEPVQSVLPFQTVKMEPEDKWYLKSQQLKDDNSSQRNKIKSNQSLKGRAFPRNDSQQLPGRPAEPKSYHHRLHPTSEFQTAPVQAVEKYNNSAQQMWLYPSPSVGPDTSGTTNSDPCLNNSLNSRHFINQDVNTSACPFHPILHKYKPVENVSPTHTNKENMKCQHDPPNGLPQDHHRLYNPATAWLFAGDDSIRCQAHPNQRNISSTFNAHFQESVKDQVSLQDCKRHTCVDKRYQNYAGSTTSGIQINVLSPAPLSFLRPSQSSACTTSQMERHYQEMIHLAEADLADRHLFSLLPPVISQAESGSEVDLASSEEKKVKISQSNSGGYPMQMEEQNQPKVSKKVSKKISKAYMNLNMKLGGLGPDYEAIKEKKEKVKKQKEYAKQIKEQNMKNIASVQRLPTKPQVVSLVSRQKALEYAKKIPRPKTFTARQSDEEVKAERIPPRSLNGDSLSQITSLETLQNRHEIEKQIVAAFRTLHIL